MAGKSKKHPSFLTISTADFVKLVSAPPQKRHGLRRPGSVIRRRKGDHKK